jgi:hypothetical protein
MTGGACGATDECLEQSCWNDACLGCGGGGSAAGDFLPPLFETADGAWYWTSSAVSPANGDAWDVNVAYAQIKMTDSEGFPDCVLCVRDADDDDDDNDNDDDDTGPNR